MKLPPMNLFEKIVTMATISASAAFMVFMFYRGRKVQKRNAYKVRQQLLKSDTIKMLYSTMSFFYLHGFESQNIDSFMMMQKVFEADMPNLVVVPISQREYTQKYKKVMAHPKYREAMDKFKHDLKIGNRQDILNLKDFQLKNMENLYLLDECLPRKKCSVVYGRYDKERYAQLSKHSPAKINQQSNAISNQKNLSIKLEQKSMDPSMDKALRIKKNEFNLEEQAKIEDFTEAVMEKMKPSMKISLVPQSPFKIIYGVIQPELMRGVAQRWKEKFKQSYNHDIIQDQEVLERERNLREAQGKTIS